MLYHVAYDKVYYRPYRSPYRIPYHIPIYHIAHMQLVEGGDVCEGFLPGIFIAPAHAMLDWFYSNTYIPTNVATELLNTHLAIVAATKAEEEESIGGTCVRMRMRIRIRIRIRKSSGMC